jgi:cytochrome P450
MVHFDVKSQAFQDDPHPTFQELRGKCPVHHSTDYGFYSVSRYDDVKSILRNTKMWSSKFGPGTAYGDPNASIALVNADPPEHDIQLRLVNKSFTRKSIDALEPDITKFVDDLIAELKPKGECDLMRDFAVHLPLFVISKMLGVDPKDGPMFRHWVEVLTLGTFGDADPKEQAKVSGALAAYFIKEIEKRQNQIAASDPPSDDLITRMLTATEEGRALEMGQVIGFISFLLVAGSGTTTMLICNTVHELLQRRDQLAKVISDADLIPAAIEESLRFRSPVHGLFRTNNESVTLHGVDIPKDSKVMCLFASANLDEDSFERPEEFDITRDMSELRRHLGFGWGTHICTGAPLARMEARIALTAILAAFKNLRLNGEPMLTEPSVLYGFDHLPVAWDAGPT